MLAVQMTTGIQSENDLVENEELLSALTQFSMVIADLGYHVTVSSARSLEKLKEVPSEKKKQITSYFKNWSLWLQSEDLSGDALEVEKSCLRKALNHFNLKVDDEFLKTIEHNHIVEIYGEDMVQLYRSLNFFKVTGYSLLDISVFEWFVLWQRPSKAIEETMNDAKTVIDDFIPAKEFKIPKQVIREIYETKMTDEEFVPRAILADFKYVGSLWNARDWNGKPNGCICSSVAEIIALGQESENIQFI